MKTNWMIRTMLGLLTLGVSTRIAAQVNPAAEPNAALTDFIAAQQATPQYPTLEPNAAYQLGQNYYSSYARTKEAAAPMIILFPSKDTKAIDVLEEDLNVISLLLERQLERVLGKTAPNYKLGIPMLLKSGNRGVQSLYIDGFGVVLTLSVNFPLVPAPVKPVVEESSRGTDWDAARKELYGGRSDATTPAWETGSIQLPEYNEEQVQSLKNALFEALKNASNIRELKPDESIIVTVLGTESFSPRPARAAEGGSEPGAKDAAGSSATSSVSAEQALLLQLQKQSAAPYFKAASVSGRGTMLTIRIRKSDADAFAKGTMNLESFREKATVHAYHGPSGRAGAALRYGSGTSSYNGMPSRTVRSSPGR